MLPHPPPLHQKFQAFRVISSGERIWKGENFSLPLSTILNPWVYLTVVIIVIKK